MGREEQKEEREVLDSIFPEEIQDISDTEYRVTVTLDIEQHAEDETPLPLIQLNVRYPEAYPDEAPDLDIRLPHDAPRHEHLDVSDDKARLMDALQPTIEENMGMAMVFTLVSTLKDAAELLIAERQNAVRVQQEFEQSKAEEEENRKFEGEKVTRETFLRWRDDFRKEMEEAKARRAAELEAEEKKKNKGRVVEEKLSGRQLWEQGLAGKGVEEDEEEGEDGLEGVRDLRVAG